MVTAIEKQLEKWWTANTVAAQCKRNPEVVRRAIRDGRLPATMVIGRWLIKPQDARTLFGAE